mmetsp:Transcript_15179/g.38361  ORF Transcript_15179/g.38361 Transcript_15179/m.38361 type:complete len:289 (+) Transcript_15179:755-1621(+)
MVRNGENERVALRAVRQREAETQAVPYNLLDHAVTQARVGGPSGPLQRRKWLTGPVGPHRPGPHRERLEGRVGGPVVPTVLGDRGEHDPGRVPGGGAGVGRGGHRASGRLALFLPGHREGHLVSTKIEAAGLPILLGLHPPRIPMEPRLQPGLPWHQIHGRLSPLGLEKAPPQGPAARRCLNRAGCARDGAGPGWPRVFQHAAKDQHALPPLRFPDLLIHRGALGLHRLRPQIRRRGRGGVPAVLRLDGLVVEQLSQGLRCRRRNEVGGGCWSHTLKENVGTQDHLGS